jgi:phosphoribosylformylglycinamidine (FGAM) synthase-like amidotransferase family enzyme
LFRYCDEFGSITADSNPNGSIENIAGVCNEARNVFGIMPHPERAADSLVANEDGLAILESILSMVKA